MTDDDRMMDPMLARLGAQLSALRSIVAIMAARHAREYDNPEAYVMSLSSAVLSAADECDPDDPVAALLADAQAETAESFETLALSLLRE